MFLLNFLLWCDFGELSMIVLLFFMDEEFIILKFCYGDCLFVFLCFIEEWGGLISVVIVLG